MGTDALIEALAALSEEELALAMPKIRELCSREEYRGYLDAGSGGGLRKKLHHLLSWPGRLVTKHDHS
jgi:hypothetical protein